MTRKARQWRDGRLHANASTPLTHFVAFPLDPDVVEELKKRRAWNDFAKFSEGASLFSLEKLARNAPHPHQATHRDSAGAAELEEALVEVLERGTFHVGAVRHVLDRRRSERGLPPPVSISIAPPEHRDLVVTPHALGSYDTLKKEDGNDH